MATGAASVTSLSHELHALTRAGLVVVNHAQRNAVRTGQRGAQARIVLKLEALTNPALIEALLEAGRAGAQIDLIVRGACLGQRVIDECLVPYLHDCRDAWAQQGDGSDTRVAQDGVSAQALMQLYAQD